jgi:hypothetical protein
MERRFFLRNALLGIVGMSAAEVRATLPRDGWKRDVDFEPYPIDLTDPAIKDTLGTQSLPQLIRIQSTRQTPDKTRWLVGEGKSGCDRTFDQALTRHNQQVEPYYAYSGIYTPVTLLKTPTHDVYGQFFHNEARNFLYGCIKGFDGQYYIVDPTFRRVFTYKYNCYGLPAADYEQVFCSKCQAMQIRQLFQRTCDQQKVMLYAYPDCAAGGKHAFIRALKPFEPCGLKDDKFNVGAEF